MTMIAVLEAEHAELQALWVRVSLPDEDRPAVLKLLMQATARHVALEKQMLVPVLEDRIVDGGAMSSRCGNQHDEIERILTLLERRKVNSPDVAGLVTELIDVLDCHLVDADTTVLPGLRAVLSEAELAELGERMLSDERRLLTHSHPSLPDSGPLAGVTRRAAELFDRVRDSSTDIGRTTS